VGYILSPRGITNDLTQDYVAARAWMDGDDPYADTSHLVDRYFGSNSGYDAIDEYGQGGTPHPPSLVVLVGAFALLPYKAARISWLLLMALATATAVGWFARMEGAKKQTAIILGIGALAIPVVQTDLVYAQSNGILLFLLVVAWASLRNKRDGWAGAALGMATALKLFPALMVIPLLRLRRYRAALAHVLSAAAIFLVSSAALGLSRGKEFIQTVSSANFRFWRAAPMNLSLLSVPYRWLTRSVWRPMSANAPGIAAVVALVLFALLMWIAFRYSRSLGDEMYWGLVPVVLLATPIVWETYLLLNIPNTLLFGKKVLNGERLPWWPTLIVAHLITIVGLVPNLPPALHVPVQAQLLGYALPMYALCLLSAGLLYANGAKSRSASPATQQP
jgi:alpha-1,2-mannosyltransferase